PAMAMDSGLRLPRTPHADERLRADAGGCDGGVRKELATGIDPPCHWRGRCRAQTASSSRRGGRQCVAGFLGRFPANSPPLVREARGYNRLKSRGKIGASGLLSALVVVVELVEQAAAIRLERPVINARRATGIGRGVERFAALSLRVVADDEIARNQVDLLPM